MTVRAQKSPRRFEGEREIEWTVKNDTKPKGLRVIRSNSIMRHQWSRYANPRFTVCYALGQYKVLTTVLDINSEYQHASLKLSWNTEISLSYTRTFPCRSKNDNGKQDWPLNWQLKQRQLFVGPATLQDPRCLVAFFNQTRRFCCLDVLTGFWKPFQSGHRNVR